MTIPGNLRRALADRSRGVCALWGAIASSPLHNALFVLFLAGILAYGAGFAWYMLANFDLIDVLGVNTDDSFYYFQIAYHLADGKFSTFDGGITQTNGYHPVWLLLITPFYWVFDKEAALFGIKAFEIMLIAGGVALVVIAAWLARLPWLLLFAALPTLYQYRALFLGLEAAAALFMLGLFFLALMLYARNPARWRWPLAAIVFALPWVRLEYIAISLAATVALCLIEWSRQERIPGASLKTMIRFAPPRIYVPIIGAVAGLLVYFAYNGLVFGGIVPVSGATKQAWSQFRWEGEGGYSFAQNLLDVLQIDAFNYKILLMSLGFCICLPLVWWFVRHSRRREDWLLLFFLVAPFSLAAGHLAKFGQTVFTLAPRWAGYDWYFVPAYLMIALIVPIACYVAIYFIRRFITPRSQYAANVLSVGIVIVGAVILLVRTDFTNPVDYVDGKKGSTGEWILATYEGTLVMNRILPDGAVVGSWDAGTVGYFSDFPVVNLDGLVNNYDFLRQNISLRVYGSGVFDLDDYAQTLHQKFGTTHYANTWPISFDFDNTLYEGPSFYRSHRKHIAAFQLWAVEPVEDIGAAAEFWERMAPHFDYQADGVGLIVDGQIAQAFARNCAPDELIVWSWAGPRDETVAKSWVQMQTGLCVAALVMPHGATHPVRVETTTASGYLAKLVADRQPAIRSDFDVYLIENRLIYVKEQCGEGDANAKFFLHLDPVDVNDLPGHRRQYGYDNRDSDFYRHGLITTGICLAEVPLPEYGIAEIRTGQYIPGEGRTWEGEIRLVE